MTHVLRKLVLAVGLAVALADGAEAETDGATAEGDLRVRWSDTAMADGWRSVCGDVWNEGQVPARGIVNPGRGPGERGRTVSSRDHYLLSAVRRAAVPPLDRSPRQRDDVALAALRSKNTRRGATHRSSM
jgi:hypothetical protein